MRLCADSSGKIEFRLLTRDRIKDALSLQTKTMRDECVAIGVGMEEDGGASDEMLLIFREVIKDGVTIIGVDVDTDQVVAVAFNKIQSSQKNGEDSFDIAMQNLKHEPCLELIKFIDEIESSVDLFEKYKVSGVLEIFYIGTDRGYQGRGIGHEIVKASVELARGLLNGKLKKHPVSEDIWSEEVIPQLVFGVFASNYSQRIAEKLGFEVLQEFRYEDRFCRGKKMSDRIGDTHKMAKLAALKL